MGLKNFMAALALTAMVHVSSAQTPDQSQLLVAAAAKWSDRLTDQGWGFEVMDFELLE